MDWSESQLARNLHWTVRRQRRILAGKSQPRIAQLDRLSALEGANERQIQAVESEAILVNRLSQRFDFSVRAWRDGWR
jgi:hypothetical protein